MTSFAVVIPAHDEESTIGRCLRFAAELEPGEAEIVVVANGCHDGTAAVARAVPGVTVLELPAASKAEALNAGDLASTAFPRVYLDADIDLDVRALRRMRDALLPDEARVCAPQIDFRTEGRPWPVRAFYRIYTHLPYVQGQLVGLGVYGVSETGRRRFEAFPAVTADDLFVQRQFSAEETTVLPGESFRVETPRTLASLIAVRTRTSAGNAELAALGERTGDGHLTRTGAATGRALLRLVTGNPKLLPHAAVYTAVTVIARLRSRRQGNGQWHRDDSTR